MHLHAGTIIIVKYSSTINRISSTNDQVKMDDKSNRQSSAANQASPIDSLRLANYIRMTLLSTPSRTVILCFVRPEAKSYIKMVIELFTGGWQHCRRKSDVKNCRERSIFSSQIYKKHHSNKIS